MMKLIYPDGKVTDEEAKEIIDFAAEGRKRVKDQLYIIDSTFCAEPAKFEYVWLKTGETVKVETLENIEHKPIDKDTEDNENENLELKHSGSRPRIKPLVAKTISIRENQSGVTYKDLFGDYLRTAKEIHITDPFIRQPYQIDNLVDFIQMVKDVSTIQDTVKIHLSTQNDDDEKVAEMIDSLVPMLYSSTSAVKYQASFFSLPVFFPNHRPFALVFKASSIKGRAVSLSNLLSSTLDKFSIAEIGCWFGASLLVNFS